MKNSTGTPGGQLKPLDAEFLRLYGKLHPLSAKQTCNKAAAQVKVSATK